MVTVKREELDDVGPGPGKDQVSKSSAMRTEDDLRPSHRLEIPLEQILVGGGSGADEDMMRGNTLAAVVGNRHYEELSELSEIDNIYFASKPFASGLLEAAEYYDFFGSFTPADAP